MSRVNAQAHRAPQSAGLGPAPAASPSYLRNTRGPRAGRSFDLRPWSCALAIGFGLMLSLGPAAFAASNDADTLVRTNNPERYRISISATKLPRRTEDVANQITVVSGDELRRRGTRTVAEALQDVVGLDTGEGSDNGTSAPNLGMWGLKEFDALLVMVDGVPVGGPFNPSLTQIPVADIDRIEIVKGPQGSLYGLAAFAGMIQVFTHGVDEPRLHGTVSSGSFSAIHGDAAASQTLPGGLRVSVWGAAQKSDNWQDLTPSEREEGRVALSRTFGALDATLSAGSYYDSQKWGLPIPVDAGVPRPGFFVDRNYAIRGARIDHHQISTNLELGLKLNDHVRVENVFGAYQDHQLNIRSWPDSLDELDVNGAGDDIPSEVVAVRPNEKAMYNDLHARATFDAGGRHELVGGAAITYGRLDLSGNRGDFDQTLDDFSTITDVGSVEWADVLASNDRRTFLGVYARDEWTPVPAVTIGGGGRYDNADEHLYNLQIVDGAPDLLVDSRTDRAWSGDLSALVRLLPHPTPQLDAVNVYANWKSSFKPAAQNLTEGEGGKILDPERTHSIEGGIKLRGLDRQVSLDVSGFDMTFSNTVVGTPSGLVNAGRERFKGFEAQLAVEPKVAPGTTVSLGYAHHDARFVHFTFLADPEDPASLRDVSGKQIELVPREMFNARVDWRAPMGFGVFGGLRYQGRRPLNRRNTFFAKSYTEYDAGASYTLLDRYRLSVTGRNLGDDRHYVTESEIGDSQFYVAPPRRVTVELSGSY